MTGRLEELAREAAEACGVEVVEVRYHAQGKHSVLRVDIDREGPAGVGLADCEAVSRRLDRSLEEAGLMQDTRFDLQVSSPGLDRPICSEDDFRRSTGRRVVVRFRTAEGPERSLRAWLLGAEPDAIRVREEGGDEVRIDRNRLLSVLPDPDPPGTEIRRGGGRNPRHRRGIV